MLGEYAVTPSKGLFVMTRHEDHKTELASLFGARMLVLPETAQAGRLNEESVKNLTGGDAITCRRMREDEWTFSPTHTAFMHTNYRPRISGTDLGIWRRIRLIPWTVTISDAEKDEELGDKLDVEAAGILNWLVAGCLDWQTYGLAEPDTVLAATEAYRAGEDHVGRFIADCLVEKPSRLDPLQTAAGAVRRLVRRHRRGRVDLATVRPGAHRPRIRLGEGRRRRLPARTGGAVNDAAMTNMTFVRYFLKKEGGCRDQLDERHVRHVPWSQRCEHDEVSDGTVPTTTRSGSSTPSPNGSSTPSGPGYEHGVRTPSGRSFLVQHRDNPTLVVLLPARKFRVRPLSARFGWTAGGSGEGLTIRE